MKTFIRIIFLSLVIVFSSGNLFAQKKQLEKANQEFDRFSYIDARAIYLKVIEDGYTSAEIYQKLGDTYYWNSDYDNAAKWYSKLANEFPKQTTAQYYFRAAQSLKSINMLDEANHMMAQFEANGGNGLLLKEFDNDPNYLQSIGLVTKNFDLEKVSINSESSDFGPSFYGANKVVYATSSNKNEGFKIDEWNQQPFLDLFVADMDEEGNLSNPRSFSSKINTPYHESSAVFTKDLKTVYFTRNNFINGKKGKDKEKTIRLKLYKATSSGDGDWDNIVELPFNSKEYSVAHPALSVNEQRLYFSSDMPGTLGMSDLWYVDIIGDNSYGTPVNLGEAINTEARESFPFISDEGKLYYSSDGLDGFGGFDVYVTTLNSSGLTGSITGLGKPVNSSQDDFGFIINEEKGLGYISSNRGSAVGGSINDEIYLIKGKCEISIKGTVIDVDDLSLIEGAEVTLLDGDNNIVDTFVVKSDAAFSFMADCDSDYALRASKNGYQPNEKLISTPDKSGEIVVPIALKSMSPCPPNDLGCILSLQPIYFDYDRFNIRPDAEIEIAKVLAAMREYPELVIHIESHTDSRAPNKYNERLSENRAQATLSWLVKKGISKSRLTAKGYGETQLTNRCSDGVACSEAEHQLNRRSMFIIQN
ncbi:OmpA family protein [Ulvibacter antarcticus]|uniref:WD40 repeat protein n=1 Tax=Ulvibacter antarcticus TaxID=442714 RepID=A0A3L9YH09_9FLAO|nr:OmpA family protein [Ulvibacter antarcticus]RMA58459.1 WD40 repeat protein [Ulvibacter antarcticus]